MTHPELVLILDYGSQYSQLIARRVRELGVLFRAPPFNISIGEDPGAATRRASSSPAARTARTNRARRSPPPEIFEPRHPRPRHLLRSPADGVPARRRSGQGRPAGIRPGRTHRSMTARDLFAGVQPEDRQRAERLDEPRRPSDPNAAGDSKPIGHTAQCADLRHPRIRRRRSTASSSTPRWCTPPRGRRSSGISSTRICGCTGGWSPCVVHRRRDR